MGEYAKFGGQEVKIGTCENMYYLRADQAHLVQPMSGNVDPIRDAAELRFRFPFPDEDTIAPGAFENYSKELAVYGVEVPADVDHGTVQFSAPNGYLVSLPCPESKASAESGLNVGRNGYGGAVAIVQQRLIDGKLVLVCVCKGCGTRYRCETLAEAAPIVEACINRAEEEKSEYWATVARRIVDGYNRPNFGRPSLALVK